MEKFKELDHGQFNSFCMDLQYSSILDDIEVHHTL
jgi:hypothetical protein